MIKTENLQKIFRTEEVETLALNDVSIEINDGEFVAVIPAWRTDCFADYSTYCQCTKLSGSGEESDKSIEYGMIPDVAVAAYRYAIGN